MRFIAVLVGHRARPSARCAEPVAPSPRARRQLAVRSSRANVGWHLPSRSHAGALRAEYDERIGALGTNVVRLGVACALALVTSGCSLLLGADDLTSPRPPIP